MLSNRGGQKRDGCQLLWAQLSHKYAGRMFVDRIWSGCRFWARTLQEIPRLLLSTQPARVFLKGLREYEHDTYFNKRLAVYPY